MARYLGRDGRLLVPCHRRRGSLEVAVVPGDGVADDAQVLHPQRDVSRVLGGVSQQSVLVRRGVVEAGQVTRQLHVGVVGVPARVQFQVVLGWSCLLPRCWGWRRDW